MALIEGVGVVGVVGFALTHQERANGHVQVKRTAFRL